MIMLVRELLYCTFDVFKQINGYTCERIVILYIQCIQTINGYTCERIVIFYIQCIR